MHSRPPYPNTLIVVRCVRASYHMAGKKFAYLQKLQWLIVMKPFCSSQIVFTPMDPDIAPDSPGSCSGHDAVLAPGSICGSAGQNPPSASLASY